MTERSIEHASFTIERRYDVPSATVFAAWADPAAKARWFSWPSEWEVTPHQFDFRVGGREVHRGGPRGGPVHTYRAIYWDIVPDERIVYTYEMLMDETRASDPDAELVDEIVLEQHLDQTRAAVNLDLGAVLALERFDVVGDVAGDQG
jgi:uncharacterized protein YndB with AHSA1/START domain